jgi:hypothetical protein
MEEHSEISVLEKEFKTTEDQEKYLVQLKNNYYSTPEYLLIFKELKNFSLLIIKIKSSVKYTFVFHKINNEIVILNSVTCINSEYLTIACKYLFDHYQIIKIRINNVYPTEPKLNISHLTFPANTDMIIHLPSSDDEYVKSLGKKTRKHMRQYLKNLSESPEHFNFSFFQIKPANSYYVKQIVNMNRLRMKKKGQVSHLNNIYQKKLVKLAEIFGWCGIATLGGKTVAGTFCFKTGPEYYLQIISHNPAMDKLELGQIVLFLTIQECIKAKGKRFHLLWGNAQYKYRFLGVQQKLYSFIFFHTRLKMYLYALPRLPSIYNDRFLKPMIYKILGLAVKARDQTLRSIKCLGT